MKASAIPLSTLLVTAATIGLVACQDIALQPTAVATEPRPASSNGTGVTSAQGDEPGGTSGGLDDAQVAAVAETIDDVAARLAELAEHQGTAPGTRRFARDMAALHRQALSETATLLTRVQLAPRSNAASDVLESVLQEELAMLGTMGPADFDRSYFLEQIQQLTASLGLLDQLAQHVRSPDLASALVSIRRRLEAHVLMARSAAERLGVDVLPPTP